MTKKKVVNPRGLLSLAGMLQDETRLKTVCVQATPLNYREYNQKLIADIHNMLK